MATHLAGKCLVVTHSDFSDYRYHGVYRVLLAYSWPAVVEDFKSAVPCPPAIKEQEQFIAWMVAQGYWEEIEAEEAWLGHWPRLEPDWEV